MKDPIYLGHLI